MKPPIRMFEFLVEPEAETSLRVLLQLYQLKGLAIYDRSAAIRQVIAEASVPDRRRRLHLYPLDVVTVRWQVSLAEQRARLKELTSQMQLLVEQRLMRASGAEQRTISAALRGVRLTEAATLRYFIALATERARRELAELGIAEVNPRTRVALPPRTINKLRPVVVKLRRDQKEALLLRAEAEAKMQGAKLNLSSFVISSLLAGRRAFVPWASGAKGMAYVGLYFSKIERFTFHRWYGWRLGAIKEAVVGLLSAPD